MKEIVFRVTPEADGGYCAAWDAPSGGGISTQGDNLAELDTYSEITAKQVEGLARALAMKSKSNLRLSEVRKSLFGMAPK